MPPYMILVNRDHPLNPYYIPPDLTEPNIPFYAPGNDPRRLLHPAAASAAEQLFESAHQNKIYLWGISGYRSYERQKELYQAASGRSTVAPPGCSEHQTGFALDVSCASQGYELEESFAFSPEGKWLASHASLFGFIIRYPKNKESITGFPWEPWHIRYIGPEIASCITLTGLTLEELL